MAFNFEFPYTDSNRYNDDWLLNTMKQLLKEFENFINLNKIKYADPILWDITRQYEVNTIVIDPQTGDAYISTKAVPYGVHLSDTNYWTKVYNYADAINTLERQIANANEELSTTATASRSIGDLVWLNGLLYMVTSPMIAGDSYVVDSNCVKVTIETLIGHITDLETTIKSNLVAAINSEHYERGVADNEIKDSIGNLNSLETSDKSSVVAAINSEHYERGVADNEIKARIDALEELHEPYTIIIGDSFAEGYSPDGYTTSWSSILRDMLGLDDSNCFIYYKGGAGFAPTDNTFLQLLQNYTGDKSKVGRIIVGGGYNDSILTTSDVKAAIQEFAEYCADEFENAKVYLGHLGWQYLGTHFQADYTTINLYKEIAKYVNCAYLTGSEYLMHAKRFISSDLLHPTQDGQNNIALGMHNAILTGSCSFMDEGGAATFTAVSGSVTTSGVNSAINNNMTKINCLGFAQTGLSIPYEFNGASLITGVLKLEGENFLGNSNGLASCVAPCSFDLLDGTFIEATANIALKNGVIEMTAKALNDARTGYASGTIIAIRCSRFTMFLDSIVQ